jgi:hypothetical protein
VGEKEGRATEKKKERGEKKKKKKERKEDEAQTGIMRITKAGGAEAEWWELKMEE